MALTDVDVKEDIIDIEIAPIKRKKFRLNGDNNKIIELNTSDLNIGARLEKGYANLRDIAQQVGNVDVNEDNVLETLKHYDDIMKHEIDFIFDSPVAEKCSDGGTMYDPYQGNMRYEHILDCLLNLYAETIRDEFAKMRKDMQKHVGKYAVKQPAPRKKSPTKKTVKR